MPSTFTSNTGIELIADGEQTGAWGQTTNDNFDIVDRALNGSVNVTLSGTTHTLTTSDGLLSDGQAAVLVFTGSPSGTNTVTIAPNTAQKTYFVTNSTAQTVVLSQGSGANVSVPAGLSKIVFTNGAGAGAAVFDITNTLSGTFTGNLTGNASTATALQTARTIGGVSFNGTANINLPGVNTGGNQNTTGSAASLTTARTIGGVSFNGTANINLPGVNTGGNQNTTGSAASLTTARTIGGVSFNGTANINLPGVNTAGNQNTTGNAATSTALQNARTIGGVSFNGTSNINLPGVNAAGNQNTTGNAASTTALQTARTINGVSFNGTANITLPTVNTSGNQTIAGTKTFSGAVILGQAGTATNRAVRADRNIATGTGILGGGNLTANRTLSIDIASQAEAEAGTDNAHVMTPLRVKQSIDALAAGGATELLSRTVISGTPAVIDFAFSATLYDEIFFIFRGVRGVNDNNILMLQTSTNGGSTFSAGASDYRGAGLAQGPTLASDASGTNPRISLTGGTHRYGNAVGDGGLHGKVSFTNNVRPNAWSDFTYGNTSAQQVRSMYGGARVAAGTVNALRFFNFTGNFANGGTIAMYGVRNS